MYVNYPYNYYQQQHQQQHPMAGPQQSPSPYYQYDIPQQHHHVHQPANVIEPLNNNNIPQYGNNYMNQECVYNNTIPQSCESAPIICTPPEWAVQAKGESRLEPIGDTAINHKSIELSSKRWFRIGRSPVSDIPLLHTTSSRNHALIFHHPNGACYIMDCKSVHGTYIDGVRMESYPHPPKKVRRGALIRFGGPGSPTFVLKRFSNEFHSFVRDMDFVAHSFSSPQRSYHTPEVTASPQPTLISESSSEEEEEQSTNEKLSVRSQYFRHPQHWIYHVRSRRDYHSKKDLDILACIRGDGGGVACIAEQPDAPDAALLLLNTRINALGERGVFSTERRNLLRKVKNRFCYLSSHEVPTTDSIDNQYVGKKRSRSASFDEPADKKYKSILSTSSMPSLEQNATLDCATPQQTISTRTTRIRFSDENELFYPQPVTPDDVSVDDEQH